MKTTMTPVLEAVEATAEVARVAARSWYPTWATGIR